MSKSFADLIERFEAAKSHLLDGPYVGDGFESIIDELSAMAPAEQELALEALGTDWTKLRQFHEKVQGDRAHYADSLNS